MSLHGNNRRELRIFGRVFDGWHIYKVAGSSTGHGIAVSLRLSQYNPIFQVGIRDTIDGNVRLAAQSFGIDRS